MQVKKCSVPNSPLSVIFSGTINVQSRYCIPLLAFHINDSLSETCRRIDIARLVRYIVDAR